jgi:hypothetical protein
MEATHLMLRAGIVRLDLREHDSSWHSGYLPKSPFPLRGL